MGAPDKASLSPLGQRPRSAPGKRLFKHPVALVLSLVLSTLLIVLIHQNLIEPVWSGTVRVTAGKTARGNELGVEVPGGFMVRLPEGTRQSKVVLVGLQKDRPAAAPSLVAVIPRERTADIKGSWKPIQIEIRDVVVHGVPGLRCTVLDPPVHVQVARLVAGRVRLQANIENQDLNYTYKVDWQPSPDVDVLAPAPFFGEDRLLIKTVTLKDIRNPQEVGSIAHDGVLIHFERFVTAVVTKSLKRTATKRLVLEKVPAYVAGQWPASSYRIEIPGWPEGKQPSVAVTLVGPPEALQKISQDPALKERLRRELFVVYEVGPVVRANRAAILKAGKKGWIKGIEGFVRQDLLGRYGVEKALPDEVSVQVFIK